MAIFNIIREKAYLKWQLRYILFFEQKTNMNDNRQTSINSMSISSLLAFISWRQMISAGSVLSQSIKPLFIAALIPFTLYVIIRITIFVILYNCKINHVTMENDKYIQEDLLVSEIYPYFQYGHATQGQRFLNFVIDNILMRLGLTYVTGYILGQVLLALAAQFLYRLAAEDCKLGLYALSFFIVIINYLFYYTLCEKLFKGQTLGKLITGTRALRTDGEELTFRDALLRSLSAWCLLKCLAGLAFRGMMHGPILWL